MKKLLKHLSKSTISILLAVLMVVSTFAVGMLTTAAAFVEQNGSVGAKVDSDSVGWNDNDGIHIKIGQADWKTYKADTSTGVTESFTIDSDNTSVQFGFRAWGKWFNKSSSQNNPGYNSTTATYTAQLEGSDYSMTLPAGTYRAELVNQSGNDLTYRFYRISAGSTTYYIVGDTELGAGGWDFNNTLTETSSGSGVYTYRMTWDASNTGNYNFRIRNVGEWSGGTNYGWTDINNVTGNNGDVYATLSQGTDNNIKVKINKNCIVTLTFTASTGSIDLSFAPDTVAFDGYYVGGRFATATAAANIHSNTTGRDNAVIYGEVLANADGVDKYSGATATSTGSNTAGYWSWHETSTQVKMSQVSGNTAGSRVYKLETHRTIKQLSEDKDNLLEEFGGVRDNGHDPFYFIIHDQNHKLGGTGSLGSNFQNCDEESKALTLHTYTNISLSVEMRFNNYASQSNGQVVLWLNENGYDPETGLGTPKIWYTIENETKPAVTNARISATPNPVKSGEKVTLKGSYTGDKNAQNLTYTFFRSTDGKSWTQIRTAQSSDTFEYTESSTGGTVYYKVVIGASDTYDNGKVYDTRTAQTSVQVYSPGIFMSNHIANTDSVTWSDDLTNPYQTADYPYKRTTDSDYNNKHPYEFAFSSMSGTWDPNFAKYEIDTASNQFCTIEYGTKDVTIDGEDSTVLTYKVRPNPNCSDPRIYVDFNNQKIWAIATYTASSNSKKSIDNYGSETVTYYFAEASYCKDKSNPTSGTGMRIHYWNNSNTSLNDNADVTTPVEVRGKNTDGNDTTNNSIYVSRGNLFGTENQDKNLVEFKVYSVELPIWATSFQFTNSSTAAFDAQPTYTADLTTKDHSITLNPNRIYVLYEYGDKYFVKGVVLDESMWNAKRTTEANEVKTKGFDTNIINYTDNNRFQNPDKPNWALNTAYRDHETPWGLYFGYFSTTNSTVATGQAGVQNDYNSWQQELYSFGKSNAKQWAANLAQRAGNNSYYASVQNLVGMTTSSTKFNTNGDGSTFGYLLDTKANNETADIIGSGKSTASNQPLFEYDDYIGTVSDATYGHGNATTIVSQGQKFPFYESTLNGITTYSFDSTTDRNRTFDTTNGFQVQDGFATGQDAGGTQYVGLFPFGGNTNQYSNCGFALEYDLTFYMTNTGYLTDTNNNKKDIAFNFSGDDDVWVYVDGVKVLDLGGSHKISAGTINFTDRMVYYKSSANDINSVTGVKDAWASGDNNYINAVDLSELMAAYGKPFDPTDAATRHTFQMFYLERGAMQSNCVISFNLPQASGLNIKNTITADMVNEPLKQKVLHIANNEDYFTYTVDSKLATSAPSGANAPATASNYGLSIDNSKPVYPYGHKTTRRYNDGTNSIVDYVLSTSGGTGGGSEEHTFNTTDWTRLSGTVYNLSESGYAKLDSDDERYAKVTGKTDTAENNGVFHLLGSEMATFENKVPTNAYVKVSQTQALGGVNKNNNDSPITFKPLISNEVGNYYNTSVSIYDEKAKKYIVDKNLIPLIKSGNGFTMTYDTKQDDAGSGNGFYFSNYSGDNDDRAAMTVEYYNDIAVGTIRIDKELEDYSTSNANFNFTVKLGRLFGSGEDELKEYPGLEYEVYNSDGTKAYSEVQYYGRGGVVLKAGQYALIKGIPVETRFEIEERPTAGYSFVKYTKTTTKSTGDAVTHTPVATGAGTDYNESSTTSQKTSSTIFDHDGASAAADDYFAYYKNMIPPVIETFVSGTKINQPNNPYNGQFTNMSISKVDFVNKRETFTVTFRYYDRDITNNQPASISSSTTEWSNNFENLDSYIVTKGSNDDAFKNLPKYDQVATGEFIAYNYEKMINDQLAAFVSGTGVTGVSNLIDDYSVWTTQAKALTGIKEKTNLRTGHTFATDYTGEDAAKLAYHTTRNGEVNTSGEKWVTYYTTGKKETRDPETHTETSFFAGDMSNYEQIKEIVVWLYNEPKAYTVNVYGATSIDDLVSKQNITLAGSGVTIQGAYVAKSDSSSKYANVKGYYSQRLGGKKGDAYLDDIAYLKAYGVDSCVNIGTSDTIVRVEPESMAPKAIGNLLFAYWAYDPEGTQVATTDYIYGYRITGNFDLYAVYAPAAMKKDGSEFGLTIVEDANDAYISSGKPMTRINTMFNPYNLNDYDTKIKRVAVVNIYVTKLLQQNYSDEQIKALQAIFAGQLKSMLAANTFNPLTGNGLNVELTTKGYVYATNAGAQTTANLTNKNRIEFTTQFNNTQLYVDGKTVRIWQIGAMGYDKNDDSEIAADEWVLSDNSIVRTFSKS